MRISNILGIQHEVRSFVESDRFVSNRLIGIEVEVENAQALRGTVFKYWNVIDDSSLRNNGVEILLRQPMCGADLLAALNELQSIFAECPSINVSERCSVHVHVDVRDLDHTVVASVLAAYIGVESGLYKLGGKNRYDNIYCPGVTSALEQTELMRRVVRGNGGDFASACNEWCKYTGVNLRSIIQRGSIEFRAHEGTLEVSRIEQWVRVLQRLFVYAELVADPDAILAHVQEGWEEFAERVFESDAQAVIGDGVYAEFYKNNLTNLIDVLDSGIWYEPERSTSRTGVDGDVDSIIAEINALLGD